MARRLQTLGNDYLMPHAENRGSQVGDTAKRSFARELFDDNLDLVSGGWRAPSREVIKVLAKDVAGTGSRATLAPQRASAKSLDARKSSSIQPRLNTLATLGFSSSRPRWAMAL